MGDIKLDAVKFYQDELWNGSGKERGLTYIRSRGVSDKIANKMKLGYAPGRQALHNHLSTKYSDEDLTSSGLVKLTKNGMQDFFNDYIIFPVINNNTCETITSRRCTDRNPKHLHLTGARKTLYNIRALSSKDPIILVESPFNALSLVEWGYPVVATLGANSFTLEVAELFKDKKPPYILYDHDLNGSGQKAAIKTAALLYIACKKVPFIVNMPVDIDVNKYAMNNTCDTFIINVMSTADKAFNCKGFWTMVDKLLKPNKQKKVTKSNTSVKEIPILDIVARLGIEVNNYGNLLRAICPLPEHKEQEESFTIYPKTNTIKCFGCGFFGDGIEIVKRIKHLNYTEAITYLKQIYIKE